MPSPLVVITIAFFIALVCVIMSIVFAYAKRDVIVDVTFLEVHE